MSLEPRNSESDGLERRSAGRDALERFREAVQAEDWPELQQLWSSLPVSLQTSRSGRGIWAGMQRALGVYDVAGKAYYDLYKSERQPAYLRDAAVCFIEGESWSLASGVLEYLCIKSEYHPIFPELASKLRQAVHLDDLYMLSRFPSQDIDDRLKPWTEVQTQEIRRSILKVFIAITKRRPDAAAIATLAMAGLGLRLECMTADAMESLTTNDISKWLYLANLRSASGEHGEAIEAYCRAMSANSSLPEVVPHLSGNQTPFVLLHRGEAAFVEYAIRSLRACHPARRIILITDDHHRYDSELNIEYRQWATYNDKALGLVKSYEHRSVNLYAFELLCLERWIVLREFCSREGIEKVIHLDTDILAFENFDVVEKNFGAEDVATCGISPHVAIMTRRAIGDMADLIVDFFQGHRRPSELAENSGISDMSFLGYLAQQYGWRSLHKSGLQSAVDHHIRCDEGYRMKDGYKDFEFVHGKPIGYELQSGLRKPFAMVHFQGAAKSLMKEYFERAFGTL